MKNDNVPQKVIDLMKADKFVDLCGITLDEIGPGYAKTSVDIQPQHLNGAGIIQGGVLFISLAFCLINLLIDIAYSFLDPKIKSQYK